MPIPDLTAAAPPLTLQTLAALMLVGTVAAGVLAHAQRKVRSHDVVVAAGWGLGGALAVGTALWLLQLLVWRGMKGPWTAWFMPEPLGLAWLLAVGGVALALLAGRALPAPRGPQAAGVLLLVPTLVLVFVVSGAALAHPPRWNALAAGPVVAALATALVGLWVALSLLNGERRRSIRWPAAQGLAGGVVFALALAIAQALALHALQLPLLASYGGIDGEAAALAARSMPVEAFDSRLMMLAMSAAAGTLALAALCVLVDTRTGRRAHSLAGSLQAANRQLRELAFRDPLTGLPNRLQFEERLDHTLDQVGRAPSAMAVLFIDIDGFKAVNESFGHAAGDQVLQEVGQRLSALAREQDTAARIGGDEFLLLVSQPGTPAAAAAVAQRGLHALVAPYRLPDGNEVRLSCSIGIAMFPEHGPTTRLIGNADAAMLAVKRTGGATYAFFEPRMEIDASDQLALQTDLRQAIERNELSLHYQPKVDAQTRLMTGVEALVRWQHPTRGAVAPSVLIPVAERFGLIGVLGHWVIDQACRQIQLWQGEGLRMRVAVNLSAHQLRQDDLVPRIRRTMARHGVDPSLLTFEITESVAMEDTLATMRSFAQLARAGASLAIDDFGTGHSSLAYLRKLPARQLKIDRSFIADLGLSSDAMAVVDAVIKLAHALGLRVVAEGVETDRQREILLALGCDEFQGYLFARPMSAERLTLWAMGEQGSGPVLPVPIPPAKPRDGDDAPALLQ